MVDDILLRCPRPPITVCQEKKKCGCNVFCLYYRVDIELITKNSLLDHTLLIHDLDAALWNFTIVLNSRRKSEQKVTYFKILSLIPYRTVKNGQ